MRNKQDLTIVHDTSTSFNLNNSNQFDISLALDNSNISFIVKGMADNFGTLNNLMLEKMQYLESFCNIHSIDDYDQSHGLVDFDQTNNSKMIKFQENMNCEIDANLDYFNRLKIFIEFLKVKYEGPLIAEIQRLTEINLQLTHKLNQHNQFIASNAFNLKETDSDQKIASLLKDIEEKTSEIKSLKQKLVSETKIITECIENGQLLNDNIISQSKGNY